MASGKGQCTDQRDIGSLNVKEIRHLDQQPENEIEPNPNRNTVANHENTEVALVSGDGMKVLFDRKLLERESGYFSAINCNSWKESEEREIELPAVSGVGLQNVSLLLHEKTFDLTQSETFKKFTLDQLEETLATSNYLQIQSLIEGCHQTLISQIDATHCLDIEEIAKNYDTVGDIVNACDRYKKESFEEFSKTTQFSSLPHADAIRLLDSDEIWVHNESIVADAALFWFENNTTISEEDTKVLFQTIRYPLILPNVYSNYKDKILELDIFDLCKDFLNYGTKHHDDPLLIHRQKNKQTRSRMNQAFCVGTGGFTKKSEAGTSKFQIVSVDKLTKVCEETSSLKGMNGESSKCEQGKKIKGNEDESQIITQYLKEENIDFLSSRSHRGFKLPVTLCEHCVCELDNFLYVAGGQTRNSEDGRYTGNMVYRYDPRFNTWMNVASMQTPRSLFYLGKLKGHLYAVAGWLSPGKANVSVERYSPSADKWEYVAPVNIGLHEHAGIGVAELAGCTHDDLLYISGGYKGPKRGHLDKVWAYDLDLNKWLSLAPMFSARSYHAMVSYKDKIVVAGGVKYIGNDTFVDLQNCEMFDPKMNQWSVVVNLPKVSSCMGHLLVEGALFLFGGHGFSGEGYKSKDNQHSVVQIINLETWTVKTVPMQSNNILHFACAKLDIPRSLVEIIHKSKRK